MPRGFPKGNKRFTTPKVIVARAFAPRSPKWKYAQPPVRPAELRARNPRRRHRGRQLPTPRPASTRISGVAPKAYIGNYKVLTVPDAGFGLNGNSPEIVAGIEAAVRDGMDVINLSLGEAEIDPSRDIVARALDGAAAAGVVPVVAAGNDYEELGARLGRLAGQLGARDHRRRRERERAVHRVASLPAGPTPVSLRMKPDVTAPGVDVLSSVPRREGLWASFSGTSMAAPHVAGAAALLRQRHRGWTVEQIKSALVQTGKPVLRGVGATRPTTTREGGGTIDLHAGGHAARLRVADGSLVRLRRPGRLGRAPGRADRRGRRRRRLDRERRRSSRPPAAPSVSVLPTTTVPGQLVVTATASPGAPQATHTGFIVLTRGSTTRRIPFWFRVAAPALAPEPDDAAHANRHVSRRHSRAARARRLVPLPGRRARLRRRALAARPGTGLPRRP